MLLGTAPISKNRGHVFPDLQLAIVAERVAEAEHPVKVLAAEDNPVVQSVLANMLTKWGYQPVIARDGNEAWEALQQPDGPQLAIVDWMMPGLNGVEICRGVRAAAREAYVYILLLTSRADSRDLVEGMEAGADDYVTKPFKAHELRVRLRAGRRIVELQQQLLAAREALREQATHDGLTGLLNRGAILDVLRRELARASRGSPSAGLASHGRSRSLQAGQRHMRVTPPAMQSCANPGRHAEIHSAVTTLSAAMVVRNFSSSSPAVKPAVPSLRRSVFAKPSPT